MENVDFYQNEKVDIARMLAERIADGEYFEKHFDGYEIPKVNFIRQEYGSSHRDAEYFCEILLKYGERWWI